MLYISVFFVLTAASSTSVKENDDDLKKIPANTIPDQLNGCVKMSDPPKKKT